jgi:hypothetical protein
MTTLTFDATSTWVCPARVYLVDVIVWGGGAGGSQNGNHTGDPGGGGGGGACAIQNAVPCVEGTTYTVTVGAAVADQTAGNLSEIVIGAVTVRGAAGATTTTTAAGIGGTIAASLGTTSICAGGAGGAGSNTAGRGGAGGGEGGGYTNASAGGAGESSHDANASLGGTGGGGGQGGDGGAGKAYNTAADATCDGIAPGGGGAGAAGNVNTSGHGAAGRIILTWAEPPYITPGAPLFVL